MEEKEPSEYAIRVLFRHALGQEYPTFNFHGHHILDWSRMYNVFPRVENRICYLEGVRRKVQLEIEDIEVKLQANPQHASDIQGETLRRLKYKGWIISEMLRNLKDLRLTIDEEIERLRTKQSNTTVSGEPMDIEDAEKQAFGERYKKAYIDAFNDCGKQQPPQKAVAERMNMSVSTLNRKRAKHGFLWPPF